MAEEIGEQASLRSEKTVGDFLPEISWADKNIKVAFLENLPGGLVGCYDWKTKEIKISERKIAQWVDDIYQAKRKITADDFRGKIELKWDLWDDETKRSGILTYLYLRVLNRSFNNREVLKRNFEIEIVAHEARHAYDDKQGCREQIGKVGPAEFVAILAQLEHSLVYERTLFVLCLEPFWLQQTEGSKPESLHEQVGVVVTRTMLGFIEADKPEFAQQSLADKIKYIAFLPSEEFKKLCGEVRKKFEKQIYSPTVEVD